MLKTLFGSIGLVSGGLVAAMMFVAPTAAQTMFRPIAVVNDSAITGYDLAQRIQILVALGFPEDNPDALRAVSLDRLIEDRLKLQEGARFGITPNSEIIESGIEQFAQNADLSASAFRASMSAQGVSEQALGDLAAADVIWRKVVRGRFARRVEPGEAEVDAEIALARQRAGVSYRLAEIGLPATGGGRTEAETRALAEQLYESLSQGGDFAQSARSHSRAPSAARGGEIGWVPSQRLPPALADELAELQPGQVTRPLTAASGYTILKLLETRADDAQAIDSQDPELRERVRRQLANRQTARLAEGLLQELRRDALIDLR